MAKQIQLFDGTTLEFPDATPDEVMDRVAKQETARRKGPEVGKLESAQRGATQGFLFNFGDELGALAAASPIGGEQKAKVGIGNFNPIDAALGGARILGEKAGLWGDGSAQKTYEAEIARQRQADAAAQEANPGTYLAGNIGGAIANPLNRAMPAPAATVPGRIVQGAKVGAITGAGYGAGAGEGGIVDRIEKASSGALAGGLTGGVATGAIEAAAPALRRAGQIAQGIVNPDVAARRTATRALVTDAAEGRAGMTPAEYQAARARGEDVVLSDMGGPRTLATARSAADSSPEAAGALEDVTNRRFTAQAPNVQKTVEDLFGGPVNIAQVQDDMVARASRQNSAAYNKAHADAAGVDLFDATLQDLTRAPAMQQAIRDVAEAAKNRAVVQGHRPVQNPFSFGRDGAMRLRATVDARGNQTVARPNLAFWDQVKRNLDDLVSKGERAGEYARVRDIKAIRNQLRDHLDSLVDSYRVARQGAAAAFGAEDAIEAGSRFFRGQSAMSMGEAQKAISRMTREERVAFAKSYAAEMLNELQKNPDRRDVLKRAFFNNPQARLKTQMALGPRRAQLLEDRLTLESVKDRLREAVQGNSKTARYWAQMGLASGVGGAAGFFNSGDPRDIATGVLAGAAVRAGVKVSDRRVAERVGKLLASDDPAALNGAVQLIQSNKALRSVIQSVEQRLSSLGGGQVGGRAPALPVFNGRANEEPQADQRGQARPQ